MAAGAAVTMAFGILALMLLGAAPGAAWAAEGGQVARGAEIYGKACAACHGRDGRGAPRDLLGFDVELPDFTDCAVATAEPDEDWVAVVHEGGPIRGLAREMPAFGDALSEDEIRLAIGHVRTFCGDASWPRGDLNLPLPFFTEKAFPENEVVWRTAIVTGSRGAVHTEVAYERRLGARGQVEIAVPIHARFDAELGAGHPWAKGLGDIALGLKRVVWTSARRGGLASVGVEVVLPTGNEHKDLGEPHARVEPHVSWGQLLPRDWFVQAHGGIELPVGAEWGTREVFVRAALGTTLAADRGFGRAWSPQIEVLWARPSGPEGHEAEWDIVPQAQVTLSRLQHVQLSAGVRVPLTDRDIRKPQVLVYLLWDWFDGGLFDHWRRPGP